MAITDPHCAGEMDVQNMQIIVYNSIFHHMAMVTTFLHYSSTQENGFFIRRRKMNALLQRERKSEVCQDIVACVDGAKKYLRREK